MKTGRTNSMNSKIYRDMLAQKGLKNTRTRVMVLEILDHSPHPVTVDEIFIILRKMDPSVNLSTVYRTMDTLLKNAFINKTTLMDDRRARYELNRLEHRHHLVCVGCNRMIPVDGCPIDDYARTLCIREGFEPTGHRLEIYGLCLNCKGAKR